MLLIHLPLPVGEPTGACCTPPNFRQGETCLDLTEPECDAILDENGFAARWHPDLNCDDPGFFCIRWVCRISNQNCAASNDEPGCAEQECCGSICRLDPFCCDIAWDQYCSNLRGLPVAGCDVPIPNDQCESARLLDIAAGNCNDRTVENCTRNDDCTGGECGTPFHLVSTPSQQAVDREYCCLAPGFVANSVYLEFTPREDSVLITAIPHTEEDAEATAILQAYRGENPIGNCNDQLFLGCNAGEVETPASLSLHNLAVDQTHRLQVAQRNTSGPSLFRVYFEYPNPLPELPRPENDRCVNASPLVAGEDNSFSTVDATYDCPRETCLTFPGSPNVQSMESDLWYVITPNSEGVAQFHVCTAERAAFVAYESQTCDLDTSQRVLCRSVLPEDCGTGINLTVKPGTTYFLRLGGIDGTRPAGSINMLDLFPDCQFNGIPDVDDIAKRISDDINGNSIPDECEDCVLLSDPPNGAIDARQPSAPDGSAVTGWRSFDISDDETCPDLLKANTTTFSIEAFEETAPQVATVLNFFGTVILTLVDPIPAGTWTSITLDTGPASFCVAALPGDVNGDGTTSIDDRSALILALVESDKVSPERADINRDGTVAPADLLRLIDLFNGGGTYDSWIGRSIPPNPCR